MKNRLTSSCVFFFFLVFMVWLSEGFLAKQTHRLLLSPSPARDVCCFLLQNNPNNDGDVGNEGDDGWGVAGANIKKEETSEPPDLFIPIFTGVAISGFVGAYAYETLRLYQAGELYLPF